MQKDPRTGRGHWRGCHTFTDIICDGDPPKTQERRSGGLRMGGTYWYYYHRDDDIEFHNMTEPSTTFCPFLPGQCVNILEVPIEVLDVTTGYGHQDNEDILTSDHCTLNPDDIFRTPIPPVLFEKRACLARAPPLKSVFEEYDTVPTSPVLFDALNGLGPANLGSNNESNLNCFTEGFRNHSSTRSEPTPRRMSLDMEQEQSHRTHSAGALSPAGVGSDGTRLFDSHRMIEPAEATDPRITWDELDVGLPPPAGKLDFNFITEIGEAALEERLSIPTTWRWSGLEDQNDSMNSHCPNAKQRRPFSLLLPLHVERSCGPDIDDGQGRTGDHLRSSFSSIVEETDHKQYPESATVLAPSRTSQNLSPAWSPTTALSGNMSPYPSQPETPSMSEFGEYLLGSSHPYGSHEDLAYGPDMLVHGSRLVDVHNRYTGANSFTGYIAPDAEHLSALTIHNLPQKQATESDHNVAITPRNGRDLIEYWNDGSNHHQSGLSDLFEDLGYLGELIV